MSVSKTFKSITILGLGASLLLAGCSSSDETPTETKSASTSSEDSKDEVKPEEQTEEAPAVNDSEEIAKAYETYVASLYSIDGPSVQALITEQQSSGVEPTDEIAQQYTDALVAAAPEVWDGIDLESLEIQERYIYVSTISSIGSYASESGETLEASLDQSQIIIDGDKASIPVSGISAVVNGEKVDTASPDSAESPNLEFIKKDGKWFISPIGAAEISAETDY